jgi:hypothetical protein
MAAACATVLGTARRLGWVDGTEGFACVKPSRMLFDCANLQEWWFLEPFGSLCIGSTDVKFLLRAIVVYSLRAARWTIVL